jgi:hypothetical protein
MAERWFNPFLPKPSINTPIDFVQALANCRKFGASLSANRFFLKHLRLAFQLRTRHNRMSFDKRLDAADHEEGKRRSGF